MYWLRLNKISYHCGVLEDIKFDLKQQQQTKKKPHQKTNKQQQ